MRTLVYLTPFNCTVLLIFSKIASYRAERGREREREREREADREMCGHRENKCTYSCSSINNKDTFFCTRSLGAFKQRSIVC